MNGRWTWTFLAIALAGCGRAPDASAGTGAREATERYFEALLNQDWPRAYAELHPGARKRVTAEEFARLARQYCQNLGFEAGHATVRACEEHGAEAIVHVLVVDRSGSPAHHYKDTLVLRQGDGAWGVVLPRNFGQKGRR
jgi:hypothetical protein